MLRAQYQELCLLRYSKVCGGDEVKVKACQFCLQKHKGTLQSSSCSASMTLGAKHHKR